MLNCENKTRISEELPIMHYFLLLLLSMLFFLNIFYCQIYIVYKLIEDKFYSFYKVLSRMFIMLVVYVFKLYVSEQDFFTPSKSSRSNISILLQNSRLKLQGHIIISFLYLSDQVVFSIKFDDIFFSNISTTPHPSPTPNS